jgi:hypothetical protein
VRRTFRSGRCQPVSAPCCAAGSASAPRRHKAAPSRPRSGRGRLRTSTAALRRKKVFGVDGSTLYSAPVRRRDRSSTRAFSRHDRRVRSWKRYGAVVFGAVFKGARIAASPRGRKAIAAAVSFARSEDGRKLAAQLREVAGRPEARKIVADAARVARTVTQQPENRERVKAAAELLRKRRQAASPPSARGAGSRRT